MKRSSLARRLACLFTVFFLLTFGAWAQTVDPLVQFEVSTMLQASANAWNRGDLDAFMSDYLRTSELTFTSGGKVLEGYEDLSERYRKKYASDSSGMGRLAFDDIKVWSLGPDYALALGRQDLRKEGESPAGGVFSLVLRKVDGEWKIFHDHTSQFAR